jgi:hypothetical protein
MNTNKTLFGNENTDEKYLPDQLCVMDMVDCSYLLFGCDSMHSKGSETFSIYRSWEISVEPETSFGTIPDLGSTLGQKNTAPMHTDHCCPDPSPKLRTTPNNSDKQRKAMSDPGPGSDRLRRRG